MGGRSCLRWLAIVLLAINAIAGTAQASATSVQVARLDADPVPLQVLDRRFENDFIPVPGAVIRETGSQPRWWRVTAAEDVAAGVSPHLLLHSPRLSHVEAWLPGRALPIQRALVGPHADTSFATRALVVPLPDGLRAGQSVYLRVHARGLAPMRASIDPLARVHRDDLRHVGWRTLALTSLLLLSVLALGLRIATGESGYAWLSLTLLAQCGFLATSGGEVRLLPWLADLIGNDIRVVRVLALASVLSGLVFIEHYLELRTRQRGIVRVLDGCKLALGVLAVAALASTHQLVALVANGVVLVAALAVLVATLAGVGKRQRAAWHLLLVWPPMLLLVALGVGELLGAWTNPAWLAHAFPVVLAMSGLVITIGLTGTLQQLRRERDRASRQATYDALTEALARPAIQQRLQAAVQGAHESGRPLSVVFFDIDRFKRINDDYGHRVGDACLRIIALRTRNRLRTYDMMGRWGGDEMIVVLPDTRLGEALGVAENLRSAVNCRALSIDGQLFDASLSLGVAELAAGESAEDLLERADSALYASKQAGRDRVTGHDPRVTGNQPRFVAAPKSA